MKKQLAVLSLCALVSYGVARADTIVTYSLNTSADLPTPAGTVTLDYNNLTGSSAITTVTVNLNSGYSFRLNPDAQHTGFAFNLSAYPTSVTGLTSGFTYEGAGAYNDTPYGSFNDAVICSSCPSGYSGVTTLSFALHGTTLSNFVPNSSGFLLAADLVTSTGQTGAVTTTGTVPSVPEPSSLMLLGTGVLGAAGMLRKRFSGTSRSA